jgi:hypothetical protein
MREIRLSGSEGGGAPSLSLPLSLSIPFGDSQNIHAPRVQQEMWNMLGVGTGVKR